MQQTPGANGSVMVPVLEENGSLVAWMLYPDPTGILQESYYHKATKRQLSPHYEATTSLFGTKEATGMPDHVHQSVPFQHKDLDSWAGQLLFIQSPKKSKKMSTASSKGVSADRIKNDPVFERTRENMEEFTRAGKAAKLLRTVFREVMVNAKDRITQARLVQVFSRVIASDPVNGRGQRTAAKGDLQQLEGFNFNVQAAFTDSLYARCPITINRATGAVDVNIPAYVPRNMVKAPDRTTHYRIVAAVAAINFDTKDYQYDMQGTLELPWDHVATAPRVLDLVLLPASTDAIFVAMGIEYYQVVNGRSYALKTGELNATSIMKVDKL